jgi:hypothetical protein
MVRTASTRRARRAPASRVPPAEGRPRTLHSPEESCAAPSDTPLVVRSLASAVHLCRHRLLWRALAALQAGWTGWSSRCSTAPPTRWEPTARPSSCCRPPTGAGGGGRRRPTASSAPTCGGRRCCTTRASTATCPPLGACWQRCGPFRFSHIAQIFFRKVTLLIIALNYWVLWLAMCGFVCVLRACPASQQSRLHLAHGPLATAAPLAASLHWPPMRANSASAALPRCLLA